MLVNEKKRLKIAKNTMNQNLKVSKVLVFGADREEEETIFFNDAKEMLQKLTLIIAEMEAGNTSIDMRNMGQTILDALLRSKHLNKQQYGQLVKKYFKGL